jgi:predicted nucleotide-binding protein
VAAPVVGQEFVVHVFAPLDGPQAETAYQQVMRLWSACRGQLGMTEPIRGVPARALPPPARDGLPAEGVAAAQESPDACRQAVLRRVHDVLNLSAGLAQPVRSGRQLGWAECAQLWWQASAAGADAVLGEARLFLARAPAASMSTAAATMALGRSLEPLLPYGEDRPREWWRWGSTTSSGHAVWDTRPGDTGRVREIVIIAAEDREDELSAWAWSDGTAGLPPFARYLMHAAKLRYEARLLDAWGRGEQRGDIAAILAELGVALAPEAPHREKAGLLRSRLSRLRAEEARLNALKADLERLGTTVSIAHGNLDAAAGTDAGAAGMFAADQALAGWLSQQTEDYLGYLRTDLEETRRARELAREELGQAATAQASAASGASPASGADAASGDAPAQVRRRVFVVHGRDTMLAGRFFDLLRAVDLRPLEWETLVRATGSAVPSLAEVVAGAPHLAQATLVLLSPDDIVELHSDLLRDNDPPQERAPAGQARPNVLFELGQALMAYPRNTVIVEVGRMRPLSDLGGLNVIRFDGSSAAIQKVLNRLRIAGCAVDTSGVDWLDPSRFADLPACRRGPDTHKPAR